MIIADYATLFLDKVPEAGAQAAVQRVLEAFGLPDNPVTRELSDAVAKALLRRLRKQLPQDVASLIVEIGPLITKLSQTLARVIPGVTADTISQEIANRKGTTIQGAHAWMVRPIFLTNSPTSPPVRFALEVLRVEAAFACHEHGTADSLRVFYKGRALLTGAPMFGDALRAIDKGCRR